jgi:hypothetical protein
MAREHEYEILNHEDKVTGSIWWDGKEIQSDHPSLLKDLKAGHYTHVIPEPEGVELLKALPRMFKTGYTRVRKAKK